MSGTDRERWPGLKPGERPFLDAAWFYAEYRYRPSKAFVRLLARHLGWSSSDRILDLGAGPAHVSLRLAPVIGEVIVMDPEETMIEEGRRRAAAAAADNLSFVVGGSDEAVIHPSIEAAIGFYYSVGNVLVRLGERRAAFERDVRAAFADADTSALTVRLVDSALVGRRPSP